MHIKYNKVRVIFHNYIIKIIIKLPENEIIWSEKERRKK